MNSPLPVVVTVDKLLDMPLNPFNALYIEKHLNPSTSESKEHSKLNVSLKRYKTFKEQCVELRSGAQVVRQLWTSLILRGI